MALFVDTMTPLVDTMTPHVDTMTLVGAGDLGLPGHVAGADMRDIESVSMINDIRIANGLAPLIADAELTAAAAKWSISMRTADHLSHASDIADGVSGDWGGVGENVGRGGSVTGLMRSFRESRGHLANILNPTFTHVGVATAHSTDGVVFTTQRYAQRL